MPPLLTAGGKRHHSMQLRGQPQQPEGSSKRRRATTEDGMLSASRELRATDDCVTLLGR